MTTNPVPNKQTIHTLKQNDDMHGVVDNKENSLLLEKSPTKNSKPSTPTSSRPISCDIDDQTKPVPSESTISFPDVQKQNRNQPVQYDYECKLCALPTIKLAELISHLLIEHSIKVDIIQKTYFNKAQFNKWFEEVTQDSQYQFIYKRGTKSYKNKTYTNLRCNCGIKTKYKCFAFINVITYPNGVNTISACLYHTHQPSILNMLPLSSYTVLLTQFPV